jgi:hypothetical protein
MRLNGDLITSIFTAALALVAFSVTRGLSDLGVVFVDYVVALMGGLSVLVFFKGFISPERITFFESAIERNNVLAGTGILLFYLIFLPFAGFLPASYVFYFIFNTYLADAKRFSTRNLIQSALISVVLVTVFYFIFNNFLGVPLPEGSWFAEE